jgi:hypothetical protein
MLLQNYSVSMYSSAKRALCATGCRTCL